MPSELPRPLVLIVDDDDVTRLLAAEALEGAGFAIAEAADGVAALEVCAEKRPDVILLDVNMPRLDGHEVCRRLLATPMGAACAVLMMTANDDVAAVEQAFAVGATDFLTKPLNLALLAHRVRYLLRAVRAFHAERDSAHLLGRVQRLARLAHWRMRDGGFAWSCDVAAVLWPETAAIDTTQPPLVELTHPDDRAAVAAALASGAAHQLDFRLVLPDGSERLVHQEAELVDDAGVAVLIGATQDVTALRAAEGRVAQLAFFDDLTGLPGAAFLHRFMRRAVGEAGDDGSDIAVLSVSIGFGAVRGAVSPTNRDELRRAVAARAIECISGTERQHLDQPIGPPDQWSDDALVTRPNSDELVVVLRRARAAEREAIGRTLARALSDGFFIGTQELFVEPVIGIAMTAGAGAEPRTLVEHARAAGHHAREAGLSVHHFSADIHQAAQRHADVERRLRAALARLDRPDGDHGFAVHYQPRFDRRGGVMVGVEALVRWNPSDGPSVSPAEFIPIAEGSSAIVTLGMWVLGQACAQGAAWAAAGTPLRVAVNVSAAQFRAGDFTERVVATAARAGFDLGLLELEITEHATVRDVAESARLLHQLRACGVRVALDDFGVGQSSLAQLARLPVDIVKVDRSFTAGLGVDPTCDAIVSAVMALGDSLGIAVVVEGVETEQQARFLGAYPSCEIQGFFCARPQPAAAIASLVAQPFAWPAAEPDAEPDALAIEVDDEAVAGSNRRAPTASRGYGADVACAT